VLPGIDVLLQDVPEVLEGKRVGLITNRTGVDSRGRSDIDLLAALPDFQLVALFGPEHGLRGEAAPGEQVASSRDEKTGLPIYSLYGPTRKPTPEMLQGVDALVFDIQDVGVRQYTYISTMALGMRAAAEKGIPFVVLDRPNPIGGEIIEGNILEPRFESFIGIYPLPVRHGMTVGELARLFNDRFGIHADLTVVPMQGWTRSTWYDDTGLPWVNPSPNIRSLAAATDYPGTVFLETTNLSEGRGTDRPFEQTGAPWLRADEVADSMNAMNLPGIRFTPVQLQVEKDAAKYGGETMPGVRFVITDREAYRPVRTTLLLIDLVRRLHPEHFRLRNVERHAGTAKLKPAMLNGHLPELLDEWDRDSEAFRKIRKEYLLY
jgi:uncharacterized protein YbbC (DUF1343 family)